MPSPAKKTALAATGGIAAAVAAAICCAGPLVAVALGLSGAGLATTFEPWRPYFIGATLFSLGAGFFVLNREERKACQPGSLCASPLSRRRMRWLLWLATGVAVPLLTFSWWSSFIIR